ncbi:MAG: HD domain-containing protein [Bacilli bacterium]|nr:HD domain-containing protein [Bacilli bacterium]
MDIIENMAKHNLNLGKYATKDVDAYRLNDEENDIRTPFFRDIDRILYALSYTRYMNKTQVFSFNENDHICKRMVHVQYVSKIARTIGRALNLNEDLIEAAALGHDLGHVPYGHVGEKILNEISLKYNEGFFNHNIQSVRNLMYVEDNGYGKNITIQVLDAIMCHNGELVMGKYQPKDKTLDEFLDEYKRSYTDKDVELIPMTIEGCVVRLSDLIAYIGKDVEDAIRLGIITEKDIPKNVISVLGNNNKEIVNTVILDVIKNSIDQDGEVRYIKLSDQVYDALNDLKDFNYKYIYAKANSKEAIENYKYMFNYLFETYINDLKNKNEDSTIYSLFLNSMNDEYKENSDARIVIDYIAGMTDDYFMNEYKRRKREK